MSFTVRPATVSDAEPVGEMIAEFREYLRALGDPTDLRFDAAAFARDGFGVDPAFAGLVAESDSAMAGYVLYHFGYDADLAVRLVHVIDLYVRSEWRGRGVGRALMEGAAAAGRKRGAEAMFWSVYRPNRLAIRFYEGLGARVVHDLDFMTLQIGQCSEESEAAPLPGG